MQVQPNTIANESSAPFEKFDHLFRSVISVPKAAIDKQVAKWKRIQKKKRAKRTP